MTASTPTKPITAHKLLTKSTKFGSTPMLVCSNTQCAKPLEKRRYCSKCNFACYCDRECQAKDWEFHKHVCGEDLCQQFEEIIHDFETLLEHFVMMDHNLLPMPGDSRDVLNYKYEKSRNIKDLLVPVPGGLRENLGAVFVPTKNQVYPPNMPAENGPYYQHVALCLKRMKSDPSDRLRIVKADKAHNRLWIVGFQYDEKQKHTHILYRLRSLHNKESDVYKFYRQIALGWNTKYRAELESACAKTDQRVISESSVLTCLVREDIDYPMY